MAVKRIVPDLYAENFADSRTFFTDILGLEVAMEMDFITTFVSARDRSVQISVLTSDPSGLRPDYSVEVTDLEACHASAVAAACEIVYPPTNEPWGVRRFFVRDPSGALANILEHQ